MVISKDLENRLAPILPLKNILIDEELNKHLYTKIGGKADFLMFPKTTKELQEIIKFFKGEGIPITIIGKGSNLIVRDGGIRGAVISLAKLNKIKIEGEYVYAGGGACLIKTAKLAMDNHLTGLEFASGIPGTVGGAVFMNAGAYGGEMKDVLESVVVLKENNEIKIRKVEDLDSGYRKTNIEDNNEIVIEAIFKLKKGDYKEIKRLTDHLTEQRRSKQPLEHPSCGSVFKRPPGLYAGKLIQDAGLQGYRVGGAVVSTKHANFILNDNNASASDYIAVINHVREVVLEKFGVLLELEVRIIGEDL
ncbi:MAG: UDP-N-acetylmuramate dehydrogenase [Bacilli bacterium]|nr:UDP-N-acetylmuramate dehydrogenase [Bacilli bacterium]